MSDTDFTPALEALAKANILRAADRRAIVDWSREPDYAEDVTLAWVADWINRRPLDAIMRVCG